MDRRDFLKQFTLLSTTLAVPTFLARSIRAAQAGGMTQAALGNPNRILVVLELFGGCDGLNTVVPHADDNYYRNRPNLAIRSSDVLKLNDQLGFHPVMTGLKELYDSGRMAVIQGVGYPNPNRSHFRSRDIWHTAEPDAVSSEGWLAKYFEARKATGSLQGINVGGNVPRAMISSLGASPSIQSIDTYKIQTDSKYPGDDANKNAAFQRVFSEPHKRYGYFNEYVTQTVLDATLSSTQLLEGRNNYISTVQYPSTAFATNLKTIAQIISAKLGVKVFYTTIGGFDLHAQQAVVGNNTTGAQANLLTTVSGAIKAFYDDMKQMGKENEILIVTFSEFGRRVNENGSSGTDHGTANQMFIFGGLIQPGIFGTHPSLERDKLDSVGDMRFNIDFRSVYATVLSNWLGVDPVPIIGESWPMMSFI